MIIELTIQNFKSILEPTTISFASGSATKLSGNLLRHSNGERFVKSMALYGPNASGKTTVLDGLYALKTFVLFSSMDQNPTSPIQLAQPFALDKSSLKRPTIISLTIDLEGARYTLDVSVTSSRVWSETLKVQHLTKQPSRKATSKILMERTWDSKSKHYSTSLDEVLGPQLTRKAALEQTTQNRLMLGKLASLNSEIARSIIEWFDVDLDFYDLHRNPSVEEVKLAQTARLFKADKQFAARITRFMVDADTGIQTLRVDQEKTYNPEFSESEKKFEFKESIGPPGLSFRHTTQDGSEVFFRRGQESSGTVRFVALLVAILQPSPRRRLVCIDELSASMHPDLVRRLIRIVHSSSYNKLGNQVFFTTHDTHLIDPTELLRRDQVTICSKDRFGQTTTRRLDEFQDEARSDANLQKQYLQGRFGGVPVFGSTLEDVPVDDMPLEVRS